MWTMAVGLSGLVIAAFLWRFALSLVPDEHGVAVSTLPRGRRLAAMLIAVLGGAAGVVSVTAVWPFQPDVLAFGLFAAVAPGLAVTDLIVHRLPFMVSGVLAAVAALAFSWEASRVGATGSLERAGLAALAVGVLALVWWRAFDGQVGLGDVALLVVIGGFAGWLSWTAVWVAIAAGFAIAALAAGVARWRTGTAGAYLPLGPFLLTGWWAAFALYTAG